MSTVTTAPTTPTVGTAHQWLSYLGSSLRRMLSDPGFLGFILAMPTLMYLFFSMVFGQDESFGPEARTHTMVMMATYGAMGAALTAGNSIQTERSTGWFRQLMTSSLSPAGFFIVRGLASLLLIRTALATTLSLEDDLEVVGQTATCAETVQVVTHTAPDVVLLDVQMPPGGCDVEDGLDIIATLHTCAP